MASGNQKQLDIIIAAQDRASAVMDRLEASIGKMASSLNALSKTFQNAAGWQASFEAETLKNERSQIVLQQRLAATASAELRLQTAVEAGKNALIRKETALINASAAAQRHTSSTNALATSTSNLVSNLLRAVAAYASLRAVEGVISDTQKYAEQIRRVSAETGLTTEKASGLVAVTRMMKIDTSALSTELGRFIRDLGGVQNGLDGVKTGNKTALEAMKQLGIGTFDTATNKLLPTDVIITNLMEHLSKLPDSAAKAAELEFIFSRSGGGGNFAIGALVQFFDLGVEGYNKLIAVAKEAGVILSSSQVEAAFKASQAYEKLQQSILGIKIAVVQQLLPYFMQFSAWLLAHQKDVQDFFANAIPLAIYFVKVFIEGLQALRNGVTQVMTAMNGDTRIVTAAVVALGLAFLVFSPGSAILVGLAAIVGLLGLINTKNEGMPKALLNVKIAFLEVAVAVEQIGHKIDDVIGKIPVLGLSLGKLSGLLKFIPGTPQNLSALFGLGIKGADAIGLGSPGTPGPGGDTSNMSAAERALYEAQKNRDSRATSGLDLAKTVNDIFGNVQKIQDTYFNSPALPDFTGGGGEGVFDPGSLDKQKESQYLNLLQNALEDAVITLKEFKNINEAAVKEGLQPLTVQAAALLEADAQLADGTFKTQERMYELEKMTDKLTYAQSKGADAVALLSESFLKSAVDLQQKAITDLLSRPTQESAKLELEKAMVDEQINAHRVANKAIEETAKALKENLKVQIESISTTLTTMSRALDDTTYALGVQKDGLQEQIKNLRPGQVGTKKRLEDQIEAINDQEKLLKRADDLNRRPLEDFKKTLGDRGDAATQAASDAGDSLTKLKQAIEDETKTRADHYLTLKAEAQLADASLLTDKIQMGMIGDLITNFHTLSGQLVTVTEFQGKSAIPTYDAATQAVTDWTKALRDSTTAITGGVPGAPGSINGQGATHVNGDVHFHFASGPNQDAAYLLRSVGGP